MTNKYNIKILHILGDSKFGGGSLVVARLAKMAHQNGWDVDVLTTDPVYQKYLKEIGINIVDLDVIWRDIRPLRDVIGLVKLWWFLITSSYDIVHTHTSKVGIIGRLAAFLAKRPMIVHTVHGFAFHEESSASALRFYSFFERLAAQWCDRIVTVSEFHRQWALQLKIGNEHKVVAIPNGIPRDRVVPNKPPALVRQTFGVSPDELLILTHGRLSHQKGLEYLLESVLVLSRLLKRPFKLVLAGDGPQRSSLEKLSAVLGLSDYVIFTGFTHEVNNLLNACDIVVLPSLWEGLSISLLESMAAEKPIITTSIGSNLEATSNGECAILVPSKDVQQLAAKIAYLINNPTTGQSLSVLGKTRFLQNYTEEIMAKQYKSLYLCLLENYLPWKLQNN